MSVEFTLKYARPELDHIGDLVKSYPIYDFPYSIFSNEDKMGKSATISASFICYLLTPGTKILGPRIYFKVNSTDTDNQYDLYYRSCTKWIIHD